MAIKDIPGTKPSPFYQFYDVMVGDEGGTQQQPEDAQQAALTYHTNGRRSTKYYYRDYAQSQVEHYAQNREAAPLEVEVAELRSWLVTAKPRSSTDAAPMLVLCQNLLKSLLEEKAIVFERRAQVEQAAKEAAVAQMTMRIAQLESELTAANHRAALAEGKADELKVKMIESLDRIDALTLEVEQQKEVIALRDKRVASFDADMEKLKEGNESLGVESDGLRKGLATCLRSLRAILAAAQEGAKLLGVLGVLEGAELSAGGTGRDASREGIFKDAPPPASDVDSLKLEGRLKTLQIIVQMTASQLLLAASDLKTREAQMEAARAHKQEIPTLFTQDPEYQAARNSLVHGRAKILALGTFTVAPKHEGVVRAVLYLLGYPKKKLNRWQDMRKLIGPDMFKAVLTLDAENAKLAGLLKESMAFLGDVREADVLASSEPVGLMHKYLTALAGAKDRQATAKAVTVEPPTQ